MKTEESTHNERMKGVTHTSKWTSTQIFCASRSNKLLIQLKYFCPWGMGNLMVSSSQATKEIYKPQEGWTGETSQADIWYQVEQFDCLTPWLGVIYLFLK